MDQQNLKFSIIDVESKYRSYAGEQIYSGNRIVSWGIDNDIPALLWNCYTKSATLQSIIDGTVNYILGDEIIAPVGKWADSVNRRGQNMDDVMRHIAMDYMIYGNFAIQVIFNKLREVVEIYPLDVTKCRLNEARTKVFYNTKGWGKYTSKSEEYDAFDLSKINPEKLTQIYFYNGEGVRSTYAHSPWQSALYDVLTEIEATKYSLNTVAGGFSAKYVINFPENAEKTDEQKALIERGIKEKFCGSEASNNFMLYFGDDGKKIEISKVESDDTPEKYTAIKSAARENIFIAMRATPVIFGLPNASNGFSTSEYSDSFKIFNRTVVSPIQKILCAAIQKITQAEIEITPFKIDFE